MYVFVDTYLFILYFDTVAVLHSRLLRTPPEIIYILRDKAAFIALAQNSPIQTFFDRPAPLPHPSRAVASTQIKILYFSFVIDLVVGQNRAINRCLVAFSLAGQCDSPFKRLYHCIATASHKQLTYVPFTLPSSVDSSYIDTPRAPRLCPTMSMCAPCMRSSC